MNKKALLLFLILWSGFVFGMEYESDGYLDLTSKPMQLKFGYANDDKEEPINVDNFKYSPTENEKAIFDKALENADPELNDIIECEKEATKPRHRISYYVLVGSKGSGKTTLAKAFACKMGTCYYVTPKDLLRQYRNEATVRLIAIFRGIEKQPGQSVLVLDDIDILLRNHNSENSDAKMTASALRTSLDRQERNPNFFVICTASESKKLPHDVQRRIMHYATEVTNPTEPIRRELITEFISKTNIPCDLTINNITDLLVQKTNNFTYGGLKFLFEKAEELAYQFSKNEPLLTMQCFEAAFIQKEEKDRIDAIPFVSNAERRHQELLKQKQELLDKKMEFLREMHEQKINQMLEMIKLQNQTHSTQQN